jgi:hypothetical protein
MKNLLVAIVVFIGAASVGMAQSAGPTPTPSNQLTPQVLGEILRSATTFHDLVQNLNKSLGPDVHTVGPNGRSQHSVNRTAATIGAGAGVGAAIGGMSHQQEGILMGALIGGAGGMILDEILRHREETHPKPAYPVAPGTQTIQQ